MYPADAIALLYGGQDAEGRDQIKNVFTEHPDLHPVRIQAARRFYNAGVADYNRRVRSFPSVLIAGLFGFHKADFYQVHPMVHQMPAMRFAGPQPAAPSGTPSGTPSGMAAGTWPTPPGPPGPGGWAPPPGARPQW